MAERISCDVFNNDAAYIDALTGPQEDARNAAWYCLYVKYRHYATGILMNLHLDVNDPENMKDAADAYQEGLLAVLNSIQQGKFEKGRARISTYLFACCKNILRTIMRNRSRFVNLNYTGRENDNLDEGSPDFFAKEDEREYQVKMTQIKKAVSELREGCADILNRYLFAGLDAIAIAAEKEIQVQSVRTDIHRCRKKLTERLVTVYKFPPDGLWL